MSLTNGIPASELAAAPRCWVGMETGFGRKVIDPRWLKAWHEQDEAEKAKRVAAATKAAYVRQAERQRAELAAVGPVSLTDRREAEAILSAGEPLDQVWGLSTRITHAVCVLHRIDPNRLRGPGRIVAVARARQRAMYEIHRQCWWLSYPQIGRIFGGRDHTTVMHAVRVWPEKAKALGIPCEPINGEQSDGFSRLERHRLAGAPAHAPCRQRGRPIPARSMAWPHAPAPLAIRPCPAGHRGTR